MSYDLIIFDLDGTLTDPKPGITKSFQYALEMFGIHEDLDSLSRFIGPPLRESFRDYYGFSDADTEKAVVRYRGYFAESGLYENTVYPGIYELLEQLRCSGFTLAVANEQGQTLL